MKQYVITPAAGKRLVGKALVVHPAIQSALKRGSVVIIAGTTNGYVAEEILRSIGQVDGFTRAGFYRGITLSPVRGTNQRDGTQAGERSEGDVVIVNGKWQKGATIFDAVDSLRESDVVLKGANALDLARRQAAILIGHPKSGTIGAALPVVVGRRARLILPVGLEKRVPGDLQELALRVNAPGNDGPRLFPVLGEVFTELEAVSLLTGATVELVAAGGVGGAEGCVWLGVSGTPEQLERADALLKTVGTEPLFEI